MEKKLTSRRFSRQIVLGPRRPVETATGRVTTREIVDRGYGPLSGAR